MNAFDKAMGLEDVMAIFVHHGEDEWGRDRDTPFSEANDMKSKLTPLGKIQSAANGAYLIKNELVPDCATVVGIVRTEETYKNMNLGLAQGKVCINEFIYKATPDELISDTQSAGISLGIDPDEIKKFMIVARKPAIHDAAKAFAGPDLADKITEAAGIYRNGLVVVVSFPGVKSFMDIYNEDGSVKTGIVRIFGPNDDGTVTEFDLQQSAGLEQATTQQDADEPKFDALEL